jgi:hypothetical protein
MSLPDLRNLLWGMKQQVDLLQDKAIDVAIEAIEPWTIPTGWTRRRQVATEDGTSLRPVSQGA